MLGHQVLVFIVVSFVFIVISFDLLDEDASITLPWSSNAVLGCCLKGKQTRQNGRLKS